VGKIEEYPGYKRLEDILFMNRGRASISGDIPFVVEAWARRKESYQRAEFILLYK